MPAEMIAKAERASMVVREQVNEIQYLMRNVLHEGTHFGKVPGCGDKPTLLQPGAEKIALMYGWVASYSVERNELPMGHREYDVTCTLTDRKSGEVVGTGVGLCTTLESKYRYRRSAGWEDTGEPIPGDAKSRKDYYRQQGLGMKKVNGRWLWVRFLDAEKAENPDIADTYNTVLKMAKKRALVDAVKSCAAASDIFTQDIEDMGLVQAEVLDVQPVYDQPTQQPEKDQRLQPVRDLFRPFMAVTKKDKEQAMEMILQYVGAASMGEMDDTQIEDALIYMSDTITQPGEVAA